MSRNAEHIIWAYFSFFSAYTICLAFSFIGYLALKKKHTDFLICCAYPLHTRRFKDYCYENLPLWNDVLTRELIILDNLLIQFFQQTNHNPHISNHPLISQMNKIFNAVFIYKQGQKGERGIPGLQGLRGLPVRAKLYFHNLFNWSDILFLCLATLNIFILIHWTFNLFSSYLHFIFCIFRKSFLLLNRNFTMYRLKIWTHLDLISIQT